MTSITAFKGSFAEMARPNRFRVTGFGLGSNLEFMAKGASLPGFTINPVEAWNAGRAVKLAGDRIYPDWTITVYQNTDADVYREFQLWQELTLGHESNIGIDNHLAYKRQGNVEMLGRDNAVLYSYVIIGAIPTELSPLELAMDSNDTPAEFTVTLAFDYAQPV